MMVVFAGKVLLIRRGVIAERVSVGKFLNRVNLRMSSTVIIALQEELYLPQRCFFTKR
jgi:hypothetical protein